MQEIKEQINPDIKYFHERIDKVFAYIDRKQKLFPTPDEAMQQFKDWFDIHKEMDRVQIDKNSEHILHFSYYPRRKEPNRCGRAAWCVKTEVTNRYHNNTYIHDVEFYGETLAEAVQKAFEYYGWKV